MKTKTISILSLAVLLLVCAVSIQPAHAATYQVKFCVKTVVASLEDATPASGDYWTSELTNQRILGVRVRVREGLFGTQQYYDYTDQDTGCTPNIYLSSTKTYSVWVYSEASVNGEEIHVYNNDTDNLRYFVTADTDYQPTQNETVEYVMSDDGEHIGQITAAAAYSMNKDDGDLLGETFTIYNEECPDDGDPGSHSCARVGGVYLTGNGKTHKTIISHELGHSIGIKRDENEVVSINEFNNDSTPCDELTDTSHDLVSLEWQNTAAKEGFAHFYAATIWNNDNEYDCEFVYYKNIDWDKDTNPDSDYELDCESTQAYAEAECGYPAELDNKGTEVDWLQFWWDLHTDKNVSMSAIWNIWDNANPRGWESDGWADESAGIDVYSRLRQIASYQGASNVNWDEEAEPNGIDY